MADGSLRGQSTMMTVAITEGGEGAYSEEEGPFFGGKIVAPYLGARTCARGAFKYTNSTKVTELSTPYSPSWVYLKANAMLSILIQVNHSSRRPVCISLTLVSMQIRD